MQSSTGMPIQRYQIQEVCGASPMRILCRDRADWACRPSALWAPAGRPGFTLPLCVSFVFRGSGCVSSAPDRPRARHPSASRGRLPRRRRKLVLISLDIPLSSEDRGWVPPGCREIKSASGLTWMMCLKGGVGAPRTRTLPKGVLSPSFHSGVSRLGISERSILWRPLTNGCPRKRGPQDGDDRWSAIIPRLIWASAPLHRRHLHELGGEVGVACRGLGLCVAEALADHGRAMA